MLLFFGLVAVTGTVFVQTGQWRAEGMSLGFQIGFLSATLIAINNLRDIEEDTLSGKRTLAVRWGNHYTRGLITVLFVLPYVVGFRWWREDALPLLWWFPLPAFALGYFIAGRIRRTEPSPIYNKFLALAGVHLLLWTGLFTFACLR